VVRTLKSVVFHQGTMYRPYDVIPDEVANQLGDHVWTENENEVDTRNSSGPRGLVDTSIVPRPPSEIFNRPAGAEETPVPPDGDTPDGQDDGQDDGEGVQPPQDEPVSPAASDEPKAPPRSGKGSGLDAWRAYARQLGVEPRADADRDDVIAAVDAHHLAARAARE
jgi:hypothetical protein